MIVCRIYSNIIQVVRRFIRNVILKVNLGIRPNYLLWFSVFICKNDISRQNNLNKRFTLFMKGININRYIKILDPQLEFVIRNLLTYKKKK